ncbi:putative membrane protein [Kibdelosporangium banguiense]|uniref:Membrane protein n=1 Tax=Kibdelosporangium banguiense TaxID=1365924 RepID=A0ABS4U3D1_9PSEU|nr:DUF2269 family protein [Kibdelosporangium banguiense]MBP2331168.1 putative membrane protein [Kibdelosporangium banguiense]
MRELLLLGHIVFAIIWIGSHILLIALGRRASKGGPVKMVEFIGDSRWLATRLQGPAAFLVLFCGVLLVVEDGFGFTDLWIALALLGFATLLVVTATYLLPEYKQIIQLAESYGADAPDAQAKIRKVVQVMRIDSVVMIAIVLDMIIKPGL